MHVKDVRDLQMKEDWHSYHSLQIKCDLSTKAFIIGKKKTLRPELHGFVQIQSTLLSVFYREL